MASECVPNVSDCNDVRDVAVPLDEENPPADVRVDISAGQSRRRVLSRVPRQLRDNKKHVYEPVVVPLGPYHHGRDPEFEVAEQLKNEVRDILCSDKGFLLRKISERIDDVKHFYGGAGGYGDDVLAEMMLRDACFLLAYMEQGENNDLIHYRLGMSGVFFLSRDVCMLENQIPLWVINLLIPLIFQGQQSQSFLCSFLSRCAFGDRRMTQLPWGNGEEEEEEPLHLLEAKHRTVLRFVEKQESSNILRLISKYGQPRKKSSTTTNVEMWNRPFRSVTDLKAKGVHFRRSSPYRRPILLLRLLRPTPPSFLLCHSQYYELSPETETDLGVTSYINFMKTLIDTAKDVKVLRKSGILYSTLANDEEVLRMFKSIDNYGIYNPNLFNDVKMRIDEHCKSKAKTWIAELINTKFRSPWTILALAAAAFLLCLTFLQTYYTINPRT